AIYAANDATATLNPDNASYIGYVVDFVSAGVGIVRLQIGNLVRGQSYTAVGEVDCETGQTPSSVVLVPASLNSNGSRQPSAFSFRPVVGGGPHAPIPGPHSNGASRGAPYVATHLYQAVALKALPPHHGCWEVRWRLQDQTPSEGHAVVLVALHRREYPVLPGRLDVRHKEKVRPERTLRNWASRPSITCLRGRPM
ncbi:MAG: hypothetical protein IID41_06730, partial [Planctomycetes bacterium]|nr:hypothetical protein [Planctomycetota bacterium]